MGYRNPLELRPHVDPASYLMELIGNGRCWHFDAWIYARSNDLYLLTETRSGGRDVLQRNGYQLMLGSSAPLKYVWPLPGDTRPVTLQDRSWNVSRERQAEREALNAIHWSHIRPMMERRPNAYTATSACFHYIRAPSLVPLPDADNFFTYGEDCT